MFHKLIFNKKFPFLYLKNFYVVIFFFNIKVEKLRNL